MKYMMMMIKIKNFQVKESFHLVTLLKTIQKCNRNISHCVYNCWNVTQKITNRTAPFKNLHKCTLMSIDRYSKKNETDKRLTIIFMHASNVQWVQNTYKITKENRYLAIKILLTCDKEDVNLSFLIFLFYY